jgi:hypothetical protein
MSATSGHRLGVRLTVADGKASVTINDRPVGDIRRWALVNEGTHCRLEFECYRLDDVGQRIPRLDAKGEVIRPMVVRTDAAGLPMADENGRAILIDGEPVWETVRLTGVMRNLADVFLDGELPLSAANLELCEALLARAGAA